MVDVNRAQRIADQIRKELSQLLLREVKDPRIQMIAITELEVSRDLAHAKVYYSIIDLEQDRLAVQGVLEKAAGFLRTRIAKELDLRVTPKLRFIFDQSMEHGRHMSDVINAAIAQDEKNSDNDKDQ